MTPLRSFISVWITSQFQVADQPSCIHQETGHAVSTLFEIWTLHPVHDRPACIVDPLLDRQRYYGLPLESDAPLVCHLGRLSLEPGPEFVLGTARVSSLRSTTHSLMILTTSNLFFRHQERGQGLEVRRWFLAPRDARVSILQDLFSISH